MANIKVIVISSVEPEPTTAGQIKLYRHLVENPEVKLVIYPCERRHFAQKRFRHRLIARLERTKLKRWVADGEFLQSAYWLDKHLPTPVHDSIANVVVTMAHGNGCWAAQRYAQKHGLPLVTWFDDWWPDMDFIHSPLRKILEKRYRKLYMQSQLALCISEGMLALLGPHPNSQLLYPIPAKADPLPSHKTEHDFFRVMYYGNLGDYGPMLAKILNSMKTHSEVRVEVRGAHPRWPEKFKQEMNRFGLWHNHAPREELVNWLGLADAFLVPMVFEPALRRRMETSFPSKMLEMSQWGKPLVIWGPEYCSAIKWAHIGNRALCVTDANPNALCKALESLAANPAEQQRLAAAARQAAETEFNPDKIQAQFMAALHQTVAATPSSP